MMRGAWRKLQLAAVGFSRQDGELKFAAARLSVRYGAHE
jgi:hypothetical protein